MSQRSIWLGPPKRKRKMQDLACGGLPVAVDSAARRCSSCPADSPSSDSPPIRSSSLRPRGESPVSGGVKRVSMANSQYSQPRGSGVFGILDDDYRNIYDAKDSRPVSAVVRTSPPRSG